MVIIKNGSLGKIHKLVYNVGMNTAIADIVLRHGGFSFGNHSGSLGRDLPFYIASRKLYASPEDMEIIAQEVGKEIRKLGLQFNAVAGTEMAGIPLAMAVSMVNHIPFILTRRNRKEEYRQHVVEGAFELGERVLLIDDGIGTGETKSMFIEALKECGLIIHDVLVLYNAGIEKVPYYSANDIAIHSLLPHNEFVAYMKEKGILSAEFAEMLHDFWKKRVFDRPDSPEWKKFLIMAHTHGFA